MRLHSWLWAVSLVAAAASPARAQTLVAPQLPDPAAAETAPGPTPRDHGPRLRYGFSIGVMGGGGDAPTVGARGEQDEVAPALGGELSARIGVQLEDHFAIYYQAAFAAGHELPICLSFGGPPPPCPADDALYLHASSLVLETTFMHGMQIGVGGSLVAAHFDTPRPATEARGGWLFRVGYAFGGEGVGERSGFTIGAQFNLSFPLQGELLGPLVDIALSLGWESF